MNTRTLCRLLATLLMAVVGQTVRATELTTWEATNDGFSIAAVNVESLDLEASGVDRRLAIVVDFSQPDESGTRSDAGLIASAVQNDLSGAAATWTESPTTTLTLPVASRLSEAELEPEAMDLRLNGIVGSNVAGQGSQFSGAEPRVALSQEAWVAPRVQQGLANPLGLGWKFGMLLLPALGCSAFLWDLRGHRKTARQAQPHVLRFTDAAARPAIPAALFALGLTLDATEDDVKKAYRQRAMAAHPDRGGDAVTFRNLQKNFEMSTRIVRAAAARAQFQASRRAA